MAAKPGRSAGLPNSERIAQLIVSPENSDTVYASVPGTLWSDSPDRGLYKTTDGGKTWNLILKGGNLSTGCSTSRMDPNNPNVLFAGHVGFPAQRLDVPFGRRWARQAVRAAVYSVRPTAARPGRKLPRRTAKVFRRNLTAVSPSRSRRRIRTCLCVVESTDSALFVSDDGGQTWDKRDKSNWMVWRPFYFANLIVDPKNPDRVFKTDGALIMSEDGGKSFATIGGFHGAHGDVHDVWIDPTNPQNVITGDDGGMWYCYNGGNKWWKGDNLPISQFYHVSVDDADPYQRLRRPAGQQFVGGRIAISRRHHQSRVGKHVTAATVSGCSRIRPTRITSMPSIRAATSAGSIATRMRRATIQPRPNYKEKLRFNWNTPIALFA